MLLLQDPYPSQSTSCDVVSVVLEQSNALAHVSDLTPAMKMITKNEIDGAVVIM